MDHRIIKYYAGELSKEERKALLQEAFSNQELKKEMINCQHLQSLVKLHPQEKNELLGKEIWGIERSVFSMVGKNGQKVLKTKGFRHGRENGLNISKRFFSLHGLTSALRLRGFSSDIRGIALHRACRWG